MISEDKFWKIIDVIDWENKKDYKSNAVAKRIFSIVDNAGEIKDAGDKFDEMVDRLYKVCEEEDNKKKDKNHVWNYVAEKWSEFLSDDSWHYLLTHIVGCGKEAFEMCIENPYKIADKRFKKYSEGCAYVFGEVLDKVVVEFINNKKKLSDSKSLNESSMYDSMPEVETLPDGVYYGILSGYCFNMHGIKFRSQDGIRGTSNWIIEIKNHKMVQSKQNKDNEKEVDGTEEPVETLEDGTYFGSLWGSYFTTNGKKYKVECGILNILPVEWKITIKDHKVIESTNKL